MMKAEAKVMRCNFGLESTSKYDLLGLRINTAARYWAKMVKSILSQRMIDNNAKTLIRIICLCRLPELIT